MLFRFITLIIKNICVTNDYSYFLLIFIIQLNNNQEIPILIADVYKVNYNEQAPF